MRKTFAFIMILCMSLGIIGCNSNRKVEEQIQEMREIAESYYQKGDFDNAIQVYEKILDTKESIDDRDRFTSISNEQKENEVYNSFTQSLENINSKVNNVTNSIQLAELIDTERDNINTFNEYNFSDGTDIGKYCLKVRSDEVYQGLMDTFNSDVIVNSTANKGQSDAYTALTGDLTVAFADATAFSSIQMTLPTLISYVLTIK